MLPTPLIRKVMIRCFETHRGRFSRGGMSSDLFTQSLGPANTRRFFDGVFFGSVCCAQL